jgi:hypothetical protein
MGMFPPHSTPTTRARTVGLGLLSRLARHDPQEAAEAAREAAAAGETWLLPRPATSGRWLNTREAAEAVGERMDTVQKWITRGTARAGHLTRHPEGIDHQELLEYAAILHHS